MRSKQRADKSLPLPSQAGPVSPSSSISSVDSPSKKNSAYSLSLRILNGAETPLSFSQAARRLSHLNNDGRPIHITSIWRWSRHGRKGVLLEWAKFGGRSVTTVEALSRFFAALSATTQNPVRPEATTASPRPDQLFPQEGNNDERQERIERELARRFGL